MRIGFIDYYIDEWHANNYPAFIKQSPFGERMNVAVAWDQGPRPGKKPLAQWCQEFGVKQAGSAAEVVESCDCIIVLSPDHAEKHEELADLPLRSGKPVYLDKPIAPTLAAAQRLFDKAAAHKTPMFSSSALRFGSELNKALAGPLREQRPDFVATRGGNVFEIYAIHQYEIVVMAMGVGARRVMQVGNDACPTIAIDYADGREAMVSVVWAHPFQLTAGYSGAKRGAVVINDMTDFFPRFIEAMLTFFETRQSPVPVEQTLEVAALIEAGEQAVKRPFTWVQVPRA